MHPSLRVAPPAESTSFDPWAELYLPALGGETGAFRVALRRVGRLTPADRGPALAVAARACLVLGDEGEAARLVGLARSAGGPEVEALLALVAGDETVLLQRVRSAPTAGERADAACDLAAVRLSRGEVDGARAAVVEARRACRDHLEAARWSRFLAESTDAAGAWERARAPVVGDPWQDDAVALQPLPRNGWVSPARLAHRVLLDAVAPPDGTARRRLWDAGATGGWLALPHEYERLDAEDPLVVLELWTDAVVARVEEGRRALPLATVLWRRVAGEAALRGDIAQVLVALATSDRELAPLAIEAATALLGDEPWRGALWRGYRAWHRQAEGDGRAADDAWAAIHAPTPEPVGWWLGVATLAARGRPELVRTLAEEALRVPELAEAARAVLEPGAELRPVTVVSPRLRPRFGATADA